MCVVIFSTILSEIFLILRRIQLHFVYVQMSQYKLPAISLHFKQTWIFST
jgi:hypothetical protein